MLATKINDHVNAALARLMQQYKSVQQNYSVHLTYTDETITCTALQLLIAVLVDQIQNLEDVAYDMDEAQQLWNGTTYPAVGAQLDGIGEIVGISRNGLDDAQYLIFILGTIAENFSDDTIATMVNIARILFGSSIVNLLEMFPAEVNFQVSSDTTLPTSLYNTVANILQSSVGGGIGLGFLAVFDTDNPFTMGDDFGNGYGGGFDDPGTFASFTPGGLGIIFNAAVVGIAGNLISIEYTAGGSAGSEVVTVVGNAVSVQIDNFGSTASDVANAIGASVPASALITTELTVSGAIQSIFGPEQLTGGADPGTPRGGEFASDIYTNSGA